MKPLLSGKIKDINKLTYPLLASPKIDGIRCLTMNGGIPVSRKMKEIPNKHILNQICLWDKKGLDGELWIKGAKNFGDVSRGVMKRSGEPDFEYIVFDIWDRTDLGYTNRINELCNRLVNKPEWITILIPVTINNPKELEDYEQKCLDEGYEGVMTRKPNGLYKYGRSTAREEILLKLKRFSDSEAEIIGYQEQMHNYNEATKDAFGRTERSSAKAGKVPAGVLGKFLCKDRFTGVEFDVGTGFDAKQRKEFWDDRYSYIGKFLKYKFQPSGAQEKPRFPTYLGMRHEDDM